MAIDMKALERAANGDPAGRVEVNKRWLGEVQRLLKEGEAAKAELERHKRDRIFDSLFTRNLHG